MLVINILIALSSITVVNAADTSAEELEQAMKMLEQQGMTPEQVELLKSQLESYQQLEATQKKNAEIAEEQQEQQRQQIKDKQADAIADEMFAEPGVLRMGLGDQLFSFTIKQCNANKSQRGQLVTYAEVYATGYFRYTPAVVYLSKAETPAALFQTMDLLLIDLSDDEQVLGFNELIKKRDDEFQAWHTPKALEIQNSLQITDDMSIEEMNQAMNKQSEAYDALELEADARRISKTLVHGTVEVSDGIIFFTAPGISYTSSGRTPDAFSDLENLQVQAITKC